MLSYDYASSDEGTRIGRPPIAWHSEPRVRSLVVCESNLEPAGFGIPMVAVLISEARTQHNARNITRLGLVSSRRSSFQSLVQTLPLA